MDRPSVRGKTIGSRATAFVVASVVGVGLMLPAGSGAAATLDRGVDALDFISYPQRAEVERASDRIADVRAGLARDSYLAKALAVFGDAAGDAASVSLPLPGRRHLETVRVLPLDLQAPMAGLWAAVEAAEDVIGDVPWARIVRLREKLEPPPRLPFTRKEVPEIPKRQTLEALTRYYREVDALRARMQSTPPVAPVRIPAFVRALQVRTRAAAALVTAALDHYLPAIEAFSGSFRAGTKAAGCDALDAAPALCVGSNADNVHKTNAVLLIDTGGKDTYHNSAGANFATADLAVASISVNVDTEGSDTYVADPELAEFNPVYDLDGSSITLSAQGAAISGVGILVDRGGDDLYRVTPPKLDTERYFAAYHAQASSTLGGTAFLFDDSGKDVYEGKGLDGDKQFNYLAQGSAAASTAALVDGGVADDRYILESGRVSQLADAPDQLTSREFSAQGYGALGATGILSDAGGTDVIRVASDGHFIPTIDDFTRVIPWIVWIRAQGHSVALGENAEGLLLTGVGDTRYEIDIGATGPSSYVVWGQGYGFGLPSGALGAISDEGGDDLYQFESTLNFEREYIQTDECLCDAAEAVATDLTFAFTRTLEVQAFATFGMGMIEDKVGDDRYLASANQDMSFTLHDRLAKPKLPPLLRVYGPSIFYLRAQGSTTPAVILDHGNGTDRYEVQAQTNLSTRVTSKRWKGAPDMRSYGVAPFVNGHGSACCPNPGIIDEGGSKDVFSLTTGLGGRSVPDPWSSLELGYSLWPQGQALVALGQEPTILASTASPACGDPGFAGFGRWEACTEPNPDEPDHDRMGPIGSGYAPLAVGRASKLELLPGTPDAVVTDPHEPKRFPVVARLADPDGKPMAGTKLHFDLLVGTKVDGALPAQSDSPPSNWRSLYQESATTNRQGVARSKLPLLISQTEGDDLIPDPVRYYRVVVTYDGDKGFYSHRVAKLIELIPPAPGGRRQATGMGARYVL